MKLSEEEMIDQCGFVIHAVMEGGIANIHTHGLVKGFDHPDIQCVVNLPPEVIYEIFHNLVNKIKGGHRFKAGEIVSGVLQNLNVTFTWATEGDRDVLRLILPDKTGELAPDKIQGKLKLQYQGQLIQ